jgi:hypothetical protein
MAYELNEVINQLDSFFLTFARGLDELYPETTVTDKELLVRNLNHTGYRTIADSLAAYWSVGEYAEESV